jgi:hypothetical protein
MPTDLFERLGLIPHGVHATTPDDFTEGVRNSHAAEEARPTCLIW